MEKIQAMLDGEIVDGIENLSNLEPESEEYLKAVNGLEKLYKLRLEEIKMDHDFSIHKHEQRLKSAELNDHAIDRYFKLGVEGAGIVLPLIFYAIWMQRGFEFEKEGTFTSTTFKGLFQKFKTTKK